MDRGNMSLMLRNFNSVRAFSLIEMSVVLAIISLVVAGGIVTLTVSAQSAQYNATLATMRAIDDAMLKFRIANNRLPCPANMSVTGNSYTFGMEAWSSGGCYDSGSGNNYFTDYYTANESYNNNNSGMAFTEGMVPFQSLGLSPNFAEDGWGNRIRYVVSNVMTLPDAFTTYPVNASCSGIGVCDSTGSTIYSLSADLYWCNQYPRTTSAVYALISHGRNGFGAYPMQGSGYGSHLIMKSIGSNTGSQNTDEQTNCHCKSNAQEFGYQPTYVEKLPTLTSGSPLSGFDDIVSFKERWQLRTNVDLPQTVIYVPDKNSTGNGLQAFNKNGQFLCKTNAYVPNNGSRGEWWDAYGNSATTSPTVAKADFSNNLWLIDAAGVREEFPNGGFTSSYANLNNLQAGGVQLYINTTDTINDIAFDSVGNIWLADGTANKILGYSNINTQLTTTAQCTTSYANTNPVYNCTTAAPPITLSGATAPTSIAFDSNNNLWVVDTASSKQRIEQFTYSGTKLGPITAWETIGTSGSFSGTCSANKSFTSIGQITVDSSNNLWVTDITNHAIVKLNSTGQCIGVLTLNNGSCSNTSCDGYVSSTGPVGLAVDANGLVWISDPGNTRVQQLDFCTGCTSATSSQTWIQTIGGGSTCQACAANATSCSCTATANGHGSYPYGEFVSPNYLGISPPVSR